MYKGFNCSVVIVAAGSGKRMGTDISKQFLSIQNKPVVVYTLEKFSQIDEIDEIILVTKKEFIEYCKNDIVDKYNIKKVSKIIEGGKERQNSVFKGIEAIENKNSIVLIHDGVRPFVKKEHILKTIESAENCGTGVLGARAKDTIKICDKNNMVIDTPDRNFMWYIQTPQTFKYDLIYKAHFMADKEGFLGTDDAMLAERYDIPVKIIEGDYNNIKITTIEDLALSEAILNSEKKEVSENIEEKIIINKENKITLDIYTDGACSGNPGKGGYGVVMLYKGKRKELSEGFRETTNNRMEILAVIKALETLKESCNVNLYSDSKYVVDAIEKGWAKKWKANGWKRNKNDMASNIDMWDRLLNLLDIHNVNFIWVKGHADNVENERCDFLARQAIENDFLQEDNGYTK